MKILMLYPKYPQATFWNANEVQLKLTGRKANMPPLGLLTIASYFPKDFQIRLIDRNIHEESEADWEWADRVLISLMGVQRADYRQCVAKAKAVGKPIAVGGPYTHAFPEEALADGDWVCFGEAESIMDDFITDLRADRRGKRYDGGNKTDMEAVKLPRYDLLPDINQYGVMAVQFSRGCPFLCEFCDIIEIYGRVPRTKSPEQIISELDYIKSLGYVGVVFMVDDNFIGNKKRALAMLRKLAAWNQKEKFGYKLFTEVSLNLADEPELMSAMVAANFWMVFIGIETPDPKILKTTRKVQNIAGDQLSKLDRIRGHGLHITAGFIVGFDGEDSQVFEMQRQFIKASGIGVAMLGLLMALPHTQLWRRLKKENRLLENFTPMEQTVDGINFIPKGGLTKKDYLREYAQLISEIYQPKKYFGRILPALLAIKKEKVPARNNIRTILYELKVFSRHLYYFGWKIKGARWLYWKTLMTILVKNPKIMDAFAADCFYFFHLNAHAQVVEKSLKEYTKNPLPDDVLDQKISLEVESALQEVGA